MLTFNDWKNSVVGKPCKVLPATLSGTQVPQCFDVCASWTDNLGIPHFPNNPSPFPYDNAYQIYTNFSSWQAQYFTQIANGFMNEPSQGDIVVLRPNHVVVATGNNSFLNFEAVSQNYGSTPSITTVMNFPYNYFSSNGIYGWLHPKCLDIVILTDAQKWTKLIAQVESTSYSDTGFRNLARQIRDNK